MPNKNVKLFFFSLISAAFFLPLFCLAQPQVTSVTADPPSVNNDAITTLSWVINGTSAGYHLYFTCRPGIKITNYSTGAEIPCETRYTSGVNVPHLSFKLNNISGKVVSLPVRVYPEDEVGTDYDSGVRDANIIVNPVSQLFTDFTAVTDKTDTTVNPAVTEMTFSWNAPYLNSLNFQFTCAQNIIIYSLDNYVIIPCGALAFATPLTGSSGSARFKFSNSSFNDTTVIALLLPLISTDLYDSTQAKSTSLTISGRTLPAAVVVNSFAASKERISSGEGTNFSWNISNGGGANLQILCNGAITIADSQSTTTAKNIPCGSLISSDGFPTVSNLTLYFTNQSSLQQTASAYLIPRNTDGTYNAMLNKQIDIIISPPPPKNTTNTTATTPTTPTQTQTTTTNNSTGIKAIHAVTFTQYLAKTSRASQVKALQQFLAQDKTLYPEATISGYFGALTEAAVGRFQERYGIAKKGDEGYGCVGPKTRAKLNSIDHF